MQDGVIQRDCFCRHTSWTSDVARKPSVPLHTVRRVKRCLFYARLARAAVVARRSKGGEETLDDAFRNGERFGTGRRGCY